MLVGLVLIIFLLLIPIAIVISGIYQFWKGKRLVGSLIAFTGTGLGLLFMIPPLFFLLFALSIGPQEYLAFDQKLKSPDGTSWFVLYYDYGGLGDPEWYVFKIPINEVPEELKIPTSDAEKVFGTNRRLIMWNWSEAGHESNPHIKIFNQRYLVFIRGGYYHGLYDIHEAECLLQILVRGIVLCFPMIEI